MKWASLKRHRLRRAKHEHQRRQADARQLRSGTSALGQPLENAATDPCPNVNPGSLETVGWWMRRQMHETIVHRWDVERSLGSTTSMDPAVAADGIDDYLDVFVRTRGKQTLIAPLVLSTTRPPRQWTLLPAARPGRIDVVADRSVDATSELTGTPEQLLLTLWGRLTISDADLTVRGDSEVAACLRSRA